jgi:c-di-GMP-binding flagellar brake protein YcgR
MIPYYNNDDLDIPYVIKPQNKSKTRHGRRQTVQVSAPLHRSVPGWGAPASLAYGGCKSWM